MTTAGAGIGGAGPSLKLWTLVDLDRGDQIVGQFIAQNVTKEVSANISESGSINRDHPILGWIQGRTERITFSTRFWATDDEDFSPDERISRMEQLVRRQDDLDRPPVCFFEVGGIAVLSVNCLVESIGGVTFDEPREDGTLRGCSLQITLKRFEEVPFEETDPSVPDTDTRILRAKKNDTYELIALREYGDPELGILLRQLNPLIPGMDLSNLRTGDPVHIFEESNLLRRDIQPEHHALKSGAGNEAAEIRRREIFDARDDDSFTTVFSDTAPEVF